MGVFNFLERDDYRHNRKKRIKAIHTCGGRTSIGIFGSNSAKKQIVLSD